MKTNNKDIMEEYLKMSLPHINWKSYQLIWVETWKYVWPMDDTFKKQMMITIEECKDYEAWMDPTLRYSHWFKEKSHDDRPMRDHALTIIERRKRWRHKETGQVYTSWESWFAAFEWTSRAEDQLWFLK